MDELRGGYTGQKQEGQPGTLYCKVWMSFGCASIIVLPPGADPLKAP